MGMFRDGRKGEGFELALGEKLSGVEGRERTFPWKW